MTPTTHSRRPLIQFGLLALGFFILQAAGATTADRQKPMNVDHADSFNGMYAPNSKTTLRGHVVISQGTMKVTGDLATIYFDADQNVSRVAITGNPAHIQQLDDHGNQMTGDAASLDYDNIKGIAVLSGNAVIKQQGRGEAHGDKLTYNTGTSQMTGSSGGNSSVHMTFKPKPRSKSATPAAPQAAPAAPATSSPAPAASSAAPATTSTTGQP